MATINDLKYSLPEELWINILKHVSSEDAWNMIREYPHISNALQPYKALLLFGKVVQFLIDWSEIGQFRVKWSEEDEKTGLLTLPDLRSCRLVCKNWSSEIDLNFHTQNYSLVNTPSLWKSVVGGLSATDCYPWSPSFLDIMFKSLSDFAKFSEQFETLAGNRNPFPSRSFTLYIRYRFEWDLENEVEKWLENGEFEAANEKYWTALINFLQKFGKHIEHFSLDTGFGNFYAHNVNGVVQIKNLAKCLRLLPNLRSILISSFYDKWDFNSITELETTVASEFINMPKVEIANFFILKQTPQLYKSLLTAFSQSIKQLYLHPITDYCKPPPPLPALRDISLRCVNYPADLEYIKLLAQVAPNLGKFTFRLCDRTEELKNMILQACTHFPNQLKFKLVFEHKEICPINSYPVETLRFEI